METLTKMLNDQKDLILKDLKQIEHDEFELKVKKAKLTKMLKTIDKQVTTATEEK